MDTTPNLLIHYLSADLDTYPQFIIEAIKENNLVEQFRSCVRGEVDYDTFLHLVNEVA